MARFFTVGACSFVALRDRMYLVFLTALIVIVAWDTAMMAVLFRRE
jgi:hypothetical protein